MGAPGNTLGMIQVNFVAVWLETPLDDDATSLMTETLGHTKKPIPRSEKEVIADFAKLGKPSGLDHTAALHIQSQ